MSNPLLNMADFDGSKAYTMDQVDSFNYIDGSLQLDAYIQYDQSPSGFSGLGLPATGSPMAFNSLNLSGANVGAYGYSPMGAGSPSRPYTPPDGASISPQSLSFDLNSNEIVSDPSSGRASRGSLRSSPAPSTASPGPAASYSAGPSTWSSHRFNPMAAPSSSRQTLKHKRRASRATEDTDDEDEEFTPAPTNASPDSRRETIRKQRIESEQRRRDELRDGYTRLKETLPVSNQKSSKVSILERATGHIRYLETIKDQLESRLKSAEAEVHRLRNVNEALMLGAASQRAQASGLIGAF